MTLPRAATLTALLLFAGTLYARADVTTDGETTNTATDNAAAQPSIVQTNPYFDPVSPQGQQARGVYIGGGFIRHNGVRGVLRTLRRAQMDTAVIDLKDSSGRISFDTEVPELEPQEVGFIRDARALVSRLKEEGVYTIARIVCFADARLPNRDPSLAVMRQRGRRPWVSAGTGHTWLDPYNRRNHDMLIALAQEAEALGFDEIQLDYVRFPVDPATRWARFPAEDGRARAQVLLDFLRRMDGATRIPIGVDVFGLAAYRQGDPSGLGQDLVLWADHVEVISPMLYLNSMRDWHRGQRNRAQNLVQTGVRLLRERVGPRPVIRPYLQAFSQGADEYNGRFVGQQIRGARRGGADGFLFWNSASRYGLLERTMHYAARRLHPFPLGDRPRMRARP